MMASVVVYLRRGTARERRKHAAAGQVGEARGRHVAHLRVPARARVPVRAHVCADARACVGARVYFSSAYVSLAEADWPVTVTARLIAIAAGRAPEPACARARVFARKAAACAARAPTCLELQNLRGLEPAASRKAICKTVRTACTPACPAPLPAAARWRARCRPACHVERRAPPGSMSAAWPAPLRSACPPRALVPAAATLRHCVGRTSCRVRAPRAAARCSHRRRRGSQRRSSALQI